MDYYIQHSALGKAYKDHKYIRREWKNGHWVYEYKLTSPHLDMQRAKRDANRSQLSNYDKGYYDAKMGRSTPDKYYQEQVEKSAFNSAMERQANKYINDPETSQRTKNYWSEAVKNYAAASAYHYNRAVARLREDSGTNANSKKYQAGYDKGVKDRKKENSLSTKMAKSIKANVSKASSVINKYAKETAASFLAKQLKKLRSELK